MLKNAARRISYEIRTCSWPPAPQQIIEDTDDAKVNQYNFLALIVSPYSSQMAQVLFVGLNLKP